MKTKLHIFRSGTHTPMGGVPVTFSDETLERIATGYDPELSEVPIVIGHPRTDGPAWGWVSELAFSDGDLHAEAGQLNDVFSDAVDKGRYKKISAAFFTPASPNNPTPGDYYLRHVGFLGASAPALKGLESPAFSDKPLGFAEDDEFITVEFSHRARWGFKTIARLMTNLREHFIETDGKDLADRVVPSWDISAIEDAAAEADEDAAYADTPLPRTRPAPQKPAETSEPAETPKPAETFTDPTPEQKEDHMPTQEQQDALKQAQDKLVADRKAHDKEKAAFAQEQALADAKTFIAGLGGKVLPGEVDGLAAFMASIPGNETISFGDTRDEPVPDFFRNFLNALPDRVNFAEVTARGEDVCSVEFAAPAGIEVNQEKLAVDSRARALQARNPGMAYLDAVKQASSL